jgi:sulfoxide reductase heme-binding subunit YedZ
MDRAQIDMALWEAIRAAGTLSFGLLTASVMLGLSVRSKVADPFVKRGWIYELHQSLSVAALVTLVVHIALVLANRHVPFSIAALLVPFVATWRPWSIAAGVLGLYLACVLVISSYLRPAIGQRLWRLLHYSSFSAWTLALAHGFTAGTDSHRAWMIWLYALSAHGVLVLLVFRLVVAIPLRRRPGLSDQRV